MVGGNTLKAETNFNTRLASLTDCCKHLTQLTS